MLPDDPFEGLPLVSDPMWPGLLAMALTLAAIFLTAWALS